MTDSDPDSTTNIDRSGGADLNASGDITIGGDVVGRDKITITEEVAYKVHGLANPYLGLQSFTYADHAKYAGREKLIAETVARLTAPDDPLSLLFVTGASGSGKSSFVQAGVLPALEQHYTALTLKWAVFLPSRDPLAALADALWRQLGLPQYDASVDFGDFLKTHTPPQQVNVIVLDQFEELFTQAAAQPRNALFSLLTQLPPFRSTRTHIIATVRADYLPELFALPRLYDIAKRGVDLRAMSVNELREAIQQPLRAAYAYPDKGKRFQAELVEQLAHDSAPDAAYLPLLQVTLEEIWRRGTLTVGSYTNLADAIKQRADKVLEFQDYDAAQPNQPRSAEEQAAILNLCLDLVDVSLDDEARRDVRRRRSKDELVSGASERARLIDALTQARLLSVDAGSGEQSRVEVDLIHETLLSNWDRLRQAIVDQRHELRQRAHFEQQLKDWLGQNRADDYLLSGVHLAEARELERRDDVALRRIEAKDFVRLSAEREEARRQKELDDARQMVDVAQARARAERRNNILLRALVAIMLVIIAWLLKPAFEEWIAQLQARGDMANIAAASFIFGQPNPQPFKLGTLTFEEWQQQKIPLDVYRIDKYPVTNRQYGLCVTYARCSPPIVALGPEKAEHPVVYVTVLQAAAYCRWLGKRLPTEAEWERAARGTDGQAWPWGDDAPTLKQATMSITMTLSDTVPVDANPAGVSPDGVYELVGNVWEWTSSYWQDDKTHYDPQQHWDGQPASYDIRRKFVQRGGSYLYGIRRVTNAAATEGFLADQNTGFRCAIGSAP